MPTARELLEQADALMRRNRERADDDIPVLTDALPPQVARSFVTPPLRPVETPAESSDARDDVPLLTDEVEEIDAVAIDAAVDEGEPSVWLDFDSAEPSVIGDAPDSIAIVPPVELRRTETAPEVEEFDELDDELAAAIAAAPPEQETLQPSPSQLPPEPPVWNSEAPARQPAFIAGGAAALLIGGALTPVVAAASAPVQQAPTESPEADAAATPAADPEVVATPAADPEVVATRAAEPEAAAPAAKPEAIATPVVDVAATRAAEVEALVPDAEPESAATPAASDAATVETVALHVTPRAALQAPDSELEPTALPVPPPAAAEAPGAPDAAHWEAMAEEIRMQVLQRIDLFTDTGLRTQLGERLQPIVDRASADLVATINLHVGELLRAYVAEAIEREIDSWRRNH